MLQSSINVLYHSQPLSWVFCQGWDSVCPAVITTYSLRISNLYTSAWHPSYVLLFKFVFGTGLDVTILPLTTEILSLIVFCSLLDICCHAIKISQIIFTGNARQHIKIRTYFAKQTPVPTSSAGSCVCVCFFNVLCISDCLWFNCLLNRESIFWKVFSLIIAYCRIRGACLGINGQSQPLCPTYDFFVVHFLFALLVAFNSLILPLLKLGTSLFINHTVCQANLALMSYTVA